MSGRGSQAKGRRAEIELSRLLNGYGYDTRPGDPLTFGKQADIVGLEGVHIEVKRRENPDLAAALTQAREDAERFGDGIPAVFFRGNRQKWRVIMDLGEWMKLYAAACTIQVRRGDNA